MKNPIPFMLGSLGASIVLVSVLVYLDQDPAMPFWSEAKDFAVLAFILTGFCFCMSYGAAHLFAFLRKQTSQISDARD